MIVKKLFKIYADPIVKLVNTNLNLFFNNGYDGITTLNKLNNMYYNNTYYCIDYKFSYKTKMYYLIMKK